jgi:uncharacterized protein YdeI (YjbR/CyaY-like superfamily)
MVAELPELLVADAATWHQWLVAHHDASRGVFLVLARKGAAGPTRLRYPEALEEALCFGWIDGQTRRRDDASFQQRFTPRQRRSAWSKRNVTIAERLVADGRIQPAGASEIERARQDGRWQRAYAGPATISVPDDLAAALAASPQAATMFASLTSQNRYAVLYRIGTARRAETRARRIAQFVAMLARGETHYPQTRSRGG